MVLLAIDTSNRILSVALLTEDSRTFSKEKQMERGQGEALIPLIQELFNESKEKIENLDAIAVAVGPGSFTGVRIGLACAKAFGLALNIPIFGVTNLEAEAYGISTPVTVVLDSKRGDYFVQHFDKGKATDEAHIESTDELKKTLPFTAVGDAATELANTIGCQVIQPREPIAVAVAKIALSRQNNPLPAQPLYLRQADVTV